MRIGILGWGSLIWNSRQLQLASRWHRDGPSLPVEFSRISTGERLTLVLVDGVDPQQVLWAMSSQDTLESAINNLAKRENTDPDNIGLCTSSDKGYSLWGDEIGQWREAKELDAVIWTGLGSNYPKKAPRLMTTLEAASHIRKLGDLQRRDAEAYIRNAPEQINTTIRRHLNAEFGWTNNPLSPTLFEDK